VHVCNRRQSLRGGLKNPGPGISVEGNQIFGTTASGEKQLVGFFEKVEPNIEENSAEVISTVQVACGTVRGAIDLAVGISGGLRSLLAAGGKAGAAEEVTTLVRYSGILRRATGGKGNFPIGRATAQEAKELGEAWVGRGFRVSSDGKTLVSADGLRVFRPPAYKPNFGKVQANFEQKLVPGGQPISNGHLDVQ